MEKISGIFTDYILKKGIISEEDYNIYLYGFGSFLEILINIICSICIAVFLNMVKECILFFLFFIPLRSYNGGLHLTKYYSCLLFSCLTLLSVLLVIKYFTLGSPISFALFLFSLIQIKVIGSVNHPNRPVNAKEDIYFCKKANLTLILSFIIAIIYAIADSKKFLSLESLVFVLVAITMLIGKFVNDK
jgi:accessory gene regulator protein AgrB